jgi:putative DNA-invertase from lambdoid prophage Rac
LLVANKLDGFGRNAVEVRGTAEQLAAAGMKVNYLALGGVDLTCAGGRMVMQVNTAMSEFERDLLTERTHAGIARAKAEGKHVGRPLALSNKQRVQVQRALAAGVPIAQIARDQDTSRQVIMRVRDGDGNWPLGMAHKALRMIRPRGPSNDFQ